MRCQRHNRGYRKGIGRVPKGCLALSGWVVYTHRAHGTTVRRHTTARATTPWPIAVAYSRGHAESPGLFLCLLFACLRAAAGRVLVPLLSARLLRHALGLCRKSKVAQWPGVQSSTALGPRWTAAPGQAFFSTER